MNFIFPPTEEKYCLVWAAAFRRLTLFIIFFISHCPLYSRIPHIFIELMGIRLLMKGVELIDKV